MVHLFLSMYVSMGLRQRKTKREVLHEVGSQKTGYKKINFRVRRRQVLRYFLGHTRVYTSLLKSRLLRRTPSVESPTSQPLSSLNRRRKQYLKGIGPRVILWRFGFHPSSTCRRAFFVVSPCCLRSSLHFFHVIVVLVLSRRMYTNMLSSSIYLKRITAQPISPVHKAAKSVSACRSERDNASQQRKLVRAPACRRRASVQLAVFSKRTKTSKSARPTYVEKMSSCSQELLTLASRQFSSTINRGCPPNTHLVFLLVNEEKIALYITIIVYFEVFDVSSFRCCCLSRVCAECFFVESSVTLSTIMLGLRRKNGLNTRGTRLLPRPEPPFPVRTRLPSNVLYLFLPVLLLIIPGPLQACVQGIIPSEHTVDYGYILAFRQYSVDTVPI